MRGKGALDVRRSSSSKSRYFLVELIVNCLFFAMAAAICLNVFVRGHVESQKNEALSMAVIKAQNAAESVKASEGSMARMERLLDAAQEDGVFVLYYDGDWQRTYEEGQSEYVLQVAAKTDGQAMLHAEILVSDDAGTIYTLSVARYIGAGGGEI